MKNSFDDILKKKWEELHFPVDNDHRDDMIKLLDQQHRRRTGLFWWLGGIGGGITILAVIILLINGNPLAEQTPVAPKKKNEKEIITHNSESSDQHSSSPVNKRNSEVVIESERASGSANTKSSESIVQKGTTNKSIDVPIDRADNTNISKKQNTLEHNRNPTVAINAQAGFNIEESTKTNEEPKNPSVGSASEISNVISSISNESAAISNPEIIAGRNNHGITEPLGLLSIDDLLYMRESMKKIEPVEVNHHPVYLFAETGLGLIPSSSQPKYSAGWTWKAGGGLDYGLNPKQHMSLSMGYLFQKHGFDFEKTSTVQQADFGARSNFHSLSPDKLHFVYARLGFHQRIHRHILSIFAGTQYLYGAQGTIVIQSQGLLTPDHTETKYGWLNVNGMSRWLWSGEAQYGYQISPRASLHAGLKFNFTSLKITDDSLEDDGYYWNGKISSVSPFFTINYHLYGNK